ncbi:MAG: RICIN domain-containing protein [Pyrinomonadaceae bacterium]|nr:RICIN domain-containing protein [Pyrinomonadaceae bacterium]
MSKRKEIKKFAVRNKAPFLLILISLLCLSVNVFAQKTRIQAEYSVSLRELPREVYKRAGQFVEDMRYDTVADKWRDARISDRVIELYRPDIDGIAFYEFNIVNPAGETIGFVTVSNGEHEQPIANWSDKNNSPVAQLLQEVERQGLIPTRIYKLADLSYVVEDQYGKMAASTKDLPLKIVGQQREWLDKPVEPASIQSTTSASDNADNDNIPEQTIISNGDTKEKFGLEEWGSWEELKANYRETYAVINEAIRREAAADWQVERALAENGEGFFADEVGIFPTLSNDARDIKVIKGDTGAFKAEILQREGTSPAIKVTALRAADQEMPVEISVVYGGETDTIKFTVLPERYRELIGTNTGVVKNKILKTPFDQTEQSENLKWYGFGTGPWGPWYTSWAAHHNDQRLYDQINAHTGVNTSNCYSGCGATAWAMLFGWGDHRAWEQDPTWVGRSGLYRENGGYGADAHAPLYQDAGVNNMMWEIRNHIGTFCAFGSGATLPSTMWKASYYLSGRTYTTLSTNYNIFGFGLPWLRDQARDSIVNRDVPAIIGTGFLSHYPLAYGYQERSRKINLGFWQATDYDRQFYVNMGWGGSSNQWVAAHTWFVGQIYPNWATETKQLIAKHSNKCLDVNGGSGGDGANVHQWSCHGGNNQKWRLEPVKTLGNYYRILAHHSGKALDVSGISTATGANVHQWEWWMGNNQLWELIPKGNGYYMLKARHSGKCLDVSGVSTANGANVYQWDCHGGDNQLWKIVP